MFFEKTENEYKQRLSDKIGTPGVIIQVLPEVDSEFNRPFEKGRISVCYKQSEFDKPRSTNEISQDEDMQFEIIIEARKLRGPYGIYDLIEKARIALIGWRPTQSRKTYAVNFTVVEKKENLWIYSFIVATKSTVVEVDEALVGPLIDEITQQSIYGSTVTTDPTPED